MKTNHFFPLSMELFGRFRHVVVMMAGLMMLLMPQVAWADLETISIDGKVFYILRSSSDWNTFRQKVIAANGKMDVNAIMGADISTNVSCGDENSPYRGIFDGNGHTLEVSIKTSSNYEGAFRYTRSATFKNLHLTGSVSGALFVGGLVGQCFDNSFLSFEKVWVSANLETPSDTYVGGFCATATSAKVYMKHCRYDGTLKSSNSNNNLATFIGNGSGSWEHRCQYEDSKNVGPGHFGMNYRGHLSPLSGQDRCISAHDWGEVAAEYRKITDQNTVLMKMNTEGASTWQLVNGKAVPIGTFPQEVVFETYDLVPGSESGEEGLLKIPFSCDQAVEWISGSYIGEGGVAKTIAPISFGKNTYAGFIKLPATEAHRNLRLNVKLKDGLIIMGYEVKDDAVMHNPRHLTSEVLRFNATNLTDAGAVLLKWDVADADYKDAIESDQFLVLRSLTGRIEDMENIGTVPFEKNQASYVYKDSLLTSALTPELFDVTTGIPVVKYIVVRGTAQQLWGLTNNIAMMSSDYPLSLFHLLRVSDYSAKWESETDKTINVSWKYADEEGAVWDDRAKMKILVSSTNRAGEAVDTTTFEVTADEMAVCRKVLQLKRSCVNYKIGFAIESGASPISPESSFVTIRTEDDWTAFVRMVQEANGKNVNAMLLADITVNTRVGDDYAPYRGVFEGNGHKLTFNMNWTRVNAAPFSVVADAAIRNLTIAGHITSTIRQQGGIVGYINSGSTVIIENCRSSVHLNSKWVYDSRVGGIVGVAIGVKQLLIRNSVFDGIIEGLASQCNGGFVGWADNYEQITLENCLFAPFDIKTGLEDCMTWVRTSTPEKIVITNCYCTREYKLDDQHENYFVISSTADWDAFVEKVDAAMGAKDVNAILTADITVTNYVGRSSNRYYRGIFDGNGHTLNVSIALDDDYLAPFRYAKNYTIKNLTVTGTVSGRNYVSGLVGYDRYAKSNNYIENCRVSATINSTESVSAGFFAYSYLDYHNVNNCLFDGHLASTSTKVTYGAAFAGYGDYRDRISNCLENGTYTGIGNTNMNFDGTSTYGNNLYSTNNWSYHDWPSMNGNVVGNMSPSELASKLGSSNWQVSGNQVLPITSSVSFGDLTGKSADEIVSLLGNGWEKDVNGRVVPKAVDKLQAEIDLSKVTGVPTFYYESLGHIDKKSLMAITQQSSVVLSWNNVDDEPVDYYEVYRHDVKTPKDSVVLLVGNLTEMQYEDKTTSAVHQYEYFVRGVNSCEGISFEDTERVPGMCVQTATVEGYLQFPDGTGIPGKVVSTTLADKTECEVKTDESGFFRLTGLPYVNSSETVYKITVNHNGFEPKSVTFTTSPGGNHVKNMVLEISQSVKLTGYVQYNGTSIPVQGVSFMVDGYEVRTAAGKVTTDFEGKFAFRILPGAHDSIQAVMDGHKFFRGGFYHESDDDADEKKAYSFNTDKAGIMFYDDTRVKLIGRIAGGKDQGEIPLGNSLSRNNLGDDLQMVFTLEGDKSSRLVWDIQDRNKKERDEEFHHTMAHDSKYDYHTKVHTTLNRMIVTPDVHTGEYEVMLPPVKWKIQQITAKGYPTLFQDGQVGDVIDLTDSLTVHRDTLEGKWKSHIGIEVKKAVEVYNAKYSRIYHSPVIIDYKQQGFDPFSYFGDRYYSFKNVDGTKQKLSLAYGVRKKGWPKGKRDSLETVYAFGYPVFSIDKSYGMKISATEKYYYNNNEKSDTVDVIRLSGGKVTIQNGMISTTHRDTLELDSVGEANYVLRAAQTPYLLTGKDALHTVSMTLEMDGTYYEATPLRAYTLNIKPKEGAKDIISYSMPLLIDVLRDPPGGASKATLSKGSTLKYSYTMDMKWSAGVGINIGIGSGVNSFTGVVVAPMGGGAVGGVNNGGASTFGTSIDLVWSGSGQRAFNYTMTAKEDISTSSDKKLVGAKADLYIGVDQNIVVKPATAIRAIPDSVYKLIEGQLKSGRTVEIAEGVDDQGKKLHLVRDEVVTYGPVIKSSFVHSQEYIVKQLLPSLAEHILSLMYTGSRAEAEAQAEATGKPVYLSLVPKDDKDFGSKYEMIVPKGAPDNTEDEVARYQQNMLKWIEMIAQNEKEKLEATDLVKNFDVDGGASLSYSESFTSEYSVSNSFVSPITAGTAGYFDSTAGDTAMGIVAVVGPVVAKILGNILKGSKGKTTGETQLDGDEGGLKVTVDAVGFTLRFSLSPAMSFSVTPKDTETKSYSRTESFSIAMYKKNHLNFDVYRVKTKTDNVKVNDALDVFYNNNFYDMVDYDYDHMKKEVDVKNFTYARSFVYRTRAGATCRPWEDERKTLFYETGTTLDERTKKIENPVIKLDKQSISGVPFGEPARFKIYLTNESEQPEAVHHYFDLYQQETSNPDGAKLMVDGMPLTGNSRTVEIHPGEVTEKTLEVYPGEKFDYKGLEIGLISQDDIDCYSTVTFDVHYLQTAGAISITTPGDQWIMNCDAPFEKGKGWYMPVIIGGFDKNQHNFDHIEFQYKESTRGDDYWTNLCGYYADSTIYQAASGTKEMIPENGNIVARFFGDGQVMEKAYDLRAVLFCRNGNSFLTSESKVLTGVKDTRRPQLFGTPDPKSGVLGAGDNIIFNFSEDIEYNYLQATTNFEVKGETNETAIQEAPSLQFGGQGYVISQARRNFSDKNITIEVMIKPDETAKEMPIFSHGSDGKELQLWLTDKKCLKAVVIDNDTLVAESKTPVNTIDFQRVALVLDCEQAKLFLYSDGLDLVKDSVYYHASGTLTFGSAVDHVTGERRYYEGRMLQGRVWNRALDKATLNRYGNKLLTGYEMGLTDYYPMNEGSGTYAFDLAQGADLKLVGATWALPRGISLRIDKNDARSAGKKKGLQIQSKLLERDEEQDYTLMFWFKTGDVNGALLANGSGQSTDEGAVNKFFIGFENRLLCYRSNGMEYELGSGYCDGSWHHYAMTVNRQRKVASIYLDDDLKVQFTTDSLGGMNGNFYLGNMVWQDAGDPTIHEKYAISGHFDGLTLFEQALPLTLIKRYTRKSPGGEEKGLITYVDFESQVRQKTGELALQPYVMNKKVKYDADGRPTDQRDSVFVEPISEVLTHIDKTVSAPVQAYEELYNLNFSFVGRNNQLLINIDEKDTRLNKRNIYVTVADIPDKNGNFQASPATESFFVNCNPLIWESKRFSQTLPAGQEHVIEIGIYNTGGATHTYTIENLPRWISVNKTADIIEPMESDVIKLSISKDVNVGTYDQIIYLTDENGLSEPLLLELTMEGENPYWVVDTNMKRYSMNIVGQVYVGNTLVTDPNDIVAAFDEAGRCMGVNNVKYDPTTGRSMVYMTVYDSTTVAKQLYFRLWHYATGKTMQLSTSELVNFGNQIIKGTVAEPLKMFADDLYLQQIELYEGWNWLSFNVYNKIFDNLETLLSRFPWEDGDIVTEDSQDLTLTYKKGKWAGNQSKNIKEFNVSQAYSYRLRVHNYQLLELWGTCFKKPEDRTINVKKGWNSIGYTPMVNLPVSTALADYYDHATDGDVIKSQHEFAMFVGSAEKGGEWLGTLEYMKPGDGYMLMRKNSNPVSFCYPYYEPGTTFIDSHLRKTVKKSTQRFACTMNIVAEAIGVGIQENDKLVAYAEGEQVGSAELSSSKTQPVFFLNVEGDLPVLLSFAIERDGEIIATTGEVMNYEANAVVGRPDAPTKLNFFGIDQLPQNGWYTLEGVKLPKAPKQSGVYIYNGKKKVIK